jgi:hypothetical protein
MCAEVTCYYFFYFVLAFFIYMLLHYFSKTYNYDVLVQIIEEFQKCHLDHPVKKFFGECTDLKIKLDRCFRQEVSGYHPLFLFCYPLNHNMVNKPPSSKCHVTVLKTRKL